MFEEHSNLCNALIQNSSDVITLLKTDGTILFQSPSLEHVFGYRPEELIGKNGFQMIHPDDLQRVKDAFMQVLQTPPDHLSIEYRFKHKDGSWRVVESTGSNQLNNPVISGIVINSRDVTERKAYEELLNQAVKRAEAEKAKTEAIITAIGDGISIQDKDFKVLYQNQVHKNIVGGDKTGEYCYSAYAKSDRVCQGCPLALSFKDGKPHILEKRAVRDEGAIHVEIKASPIRDAEGNIIGGVEVARDITERKRTEERLLESEEKFRKIFEDSPLGIIISDHNYRLLRANYAFCNMLGYSEEEIVGKSIEDFTYPEDIKKSLDLSKHAFSGEIPLFHLEKRYIRKNGAIIWIGLTSMAIHDLEGKVLYTIGMIEDISERKTDEQEKEQLISKLKEALANIKTLKGLIPICAWCKKIRDDKGYWNRVEVYIKEHSDASFTHGICPTCLQKEDRLSYAEVFGDENKARETKTEKRLCERIRLMKPIPLSFKVEAGGSEKRILNATIEDISDAGMCIQIDYPLEDNSILIANCDAEDTIGVVRWRETAISEDSGYRVGIQFIRN